MEKLQIMTNFVNMILSCNCRQSRTTVNKMYSQQTLPDIVPEYIMSTCKHSDSAEINKQLTQDFSKMCSVQPYTSADEYLYAMKEDLADWLSVMYNLKITADEFLDVLGNGVILCEHANNVMEAIRKSRDDHIGISSIPRIDDCSSIKNEGMEYVCFRKDAKQHSFAARDNISNFIDWARNRAGVKECLMFETDDLIMYKNERNFVLCLLEVARYGSQYGLQIPRLVRFEEDIADEIRTEQEKEFQSLTLLKRLHKNQASPSWISKAMNTLRVSNTDNTNRFVNSHDNIKNTDKIWNHVISITNSCKCDPQIKLSYLGPGKFRIGSLLQPVFVRKLNNHYMINVGQRWDTLQNYLNQIDPCRHNVVEFQPKENNENNHLSPDELDRDSLSESVDYVETDVCHTDIVSTPVNHLSNDNNSVPISLIDRSSLMDGVETTSVYDDTDMNTQMITNVTNSLDLPDKFNNCNKIVRRLYVKSKTTQLLNLEVPQIGVIDQNNRAFNYSNAHLNGDNDTENSLTNSRIQNFYSSSDSLNSTLQLDHSQESNKIIRGNSITPSRIPKLTIRDISGEPIPHRLVLQNRRSKSVQSEETDQKDEIKTQSRVPRSVRKRYVDSGRSQTDTLKVSSSVIPKYLANSQKVINGSDLNLNSEAAFRENKAYRWRRKALIFRNYIRENMPTDERAAFADDIYTNFHYPDLRGSELIYGNRNDLSKLPSKNDINPIQHNSRKQSLTSSGNSSLISLNNSHKNSKKITDT